MGSIAKRRDLQSVSLKCHERSHSPIKALCITHRQSRLTSTHLANHASIRTMKITDIDVFRYTLPLVKPLLMPGQTLAEREGLIIRIGDEFGHTGLGEIAPFPGLHSEDLPAAREQMPGIRDVLAGRTLPENLHQLNGGFEKWLGRYRLFPSVQFGIESAVLGLLANAAGKPLCALLCPKYRRRISLNGLLTGSKPEVIAQARHLVREGYRALKLKVGRGSIENDIDMVREVRALLPEAVSLRLDANRAWSLENAVMFGKALSGCEIEYIEEPLENPEGLEKFYLATRMPFAFDESFAQTSPDKIQSIKGLAAFILKPGMLGGLERTMQFARIAEKFGLISVISSAFHSGVGLAAEVCLAACLNQSDIPMGFDTYQWLQEDVLIERFKVTNGRFMVKNGYEINKLMDWDKVSPEKG